MPDTSTNSRFPWSPASASGIGSLPGTDPAEAMRLIFGELPDLPHLAELPARGPGADLTGRTAALLTDLPVEVTPSGWRLTSRPGRDLARAAGMLASDLDALEEVASGYQGPLKVQVCGPWTLAATIELSRSQNPALADPGAVADLAESLAEGVRGHIGLVGKRVPGARVLLQLDEPALPAVIAGTIPTASGLARVPAPEAAEIESRLRVVLSAAAVFSIVHCCAAGVPFATITAAGAGAVSLDLARLGRAGEDGLAQAAEAGLGILAGAVPATSGPVPWPASAGHEGTAGRPGTRTPPPRALAERVIEMWRRMGWPTPRRDGHTAGPAGVPEQVVLTPSCGLAGVSLAEARAALARCREASRLLPELIEEGRW